MYKPIAVAVATLTAAVTIAFSSGAFALVLVVAPPRLDVTHQGHNTDLVCRVRGNNLFIINFGDDNIDSGRQVSWATTMGDRGILPLPKMLAPGEQVMIADALNDFAPPGDDCQAAFV